MGLVAPIRLRAHLGESARKVSWLELFFDLIFVAAVAQVAEPLREHYSLSGVLRFATLFALIWWAWTGYTVFATRFDADDGIQRLLTLVQMFVVAAMAANAEDELHSRSSAGFMAAYAVLRLVLVAQYFRARHLPEARPLTTRYIAGHGAAALIWLASAFVPAPGRYAIWTAAFVIDLGTPWLALPHSVRVPPNPAHLPERFGLFTLILLGEAVIAVMHGMKSQEEWTLVAAASAFSGMALLFLLWWWYFDIAAAAAERFVRSHRDALRFHIWSYAHFPLYLGLVVTGVGVQRTVSAAARWTLNDEEALLMTSAAAIVMLAMAVIGGSFSPKRRIISAAIPPVACSLLAIGLGIAAASSLNAPVIILGLIALCFVQVLEPANLRTCEPENLRTPWRDSRSGSGRSRWSLRRRSPSTARGRISSRSASRPE
jgi:low temperature requirement protein LtrA